MCGSSAVFQGSKEVERNRVDALEEGAFLGAADAMLRAETSTEAVGRSEDERLRLHSGSIVKRSAANPLTRASMEAAGADPFIFVILSV